MCYDCLGSIGGRLLFETWRLLEVYGMLLRYGKLAPVLNFMMVVPNAYRTVLCCVTVTCSSIPVVLYGVLSTICSTFLFDLFIC